jgi:hypothetical protein
MTFKERLDEMQEREDTMDAVGSVVVLVLCGVVFYLCML